MLAQQPPSGTATGKKLEKSILPAVRDSQLFLPACHSACLGDAVARLVAIEDRDQVGDRPISHGVAGFMSGAADVR